MRGFLCAFALTTFGALAGADTITTVDTGGVGQYTSVVYGSDGLPLIAYYDVANADLKVAHCADVACTASTGRTVDSAGDVGKHASVAIGPNGLPLIGYFDATLGRIKVARCADLACSASTTVTLTNAGPASEGGDIAVPPDGRPVLAFRNGTALWVARCTDAACTDATAVSVVLGFGNHPTITISGDGLPLVAGGNGTNAIAISHCTTPGCGATAAPLTVAAPEPEGAILITDLRDPVLARRSDGRGVLAFSVRTTTAISQSLSVTVRTCSDAACTSLVGNGGVGVASVQGMSGLPASVVPSLATGEGDVAVISSTRPTNGTGLNVGLCSTLSCFGAIGVDVDGPGAGAFSSAAVSPGGVALVAYQADAGGGSLRTIYLDSVPTADLALTMTASPNPVGAGQQVMLRGDVQNLGPGIARENVITFTLPPGAQDPDGTLSNCVVVSPTSVRCPLLDMAPGPLMRNADVFIRIPPGLAGPLAASATVSTASNDPNPANDTGSVPIGTRPTLNVRSPQVREGDSGATEGAIEVELFDDGSPHPAITASYTTGGGTATSGTDYGPASGALTFTPGDALRTVTVSVVGDLQPEGNETFFLQLSSAGALAVQDAGVTILDDDLPVTAERQLAHGVTFTGSFDGASVQNRFAVDDPPLASYEVVADAISADVRPLVMQLYDGSGTPVAMGMPSTLGGTVRLRYFSNAIPNLTRYLVVTSGGCATCGPDDVYRIRAYETTGRVARFNNVGDQATVLILQNPTDALALGRIYFWSASGVRLAETDLQVPAHGTQVLSTSSLVPGKTGSITVTNTLPYGELRGKAVALEPATGFSFDSPMTYRPK